MDRLLAIAQTGLASLLLHPLRSLVTTAAVTVLLTPYLAGLAISQGVQSEAEASIRFGADLYVTGEKFGRNAPIPLAAVDAIRQAEGVTKVVPRIIGSITLGKENEPTVIVGLPVEEFPADVRCIAGRLPRPGRPNEFVIGTELARRLKMEVGSRIPPFYHNDRGVFISVIVGIFEADAPLWQARMILTPFETAADLFNESGRATDLLVSCRPGYGDEVRWAILNAGTMGGVRPKVTSRADLEALLPRDILHREGIFNLHFVLAFVVGILVVLVTSGVGLAERRREIGILKATGWQTDELLLRGLVESFLLSLAGASLALVIAGVWVKGFNGYGIAGLFLTGADLSPAFAVPNRFAPVPALLAFVLSFAIVMSGTLYSTWRAATATPLEAMR
jgi:ABC-type lipoprotein release transport system permease subunit